MSKTSASLGGLVPPGPEKRAAAPRRPGPVLMLKTLGLAAATAFVTVNIWTGCPLFALWVGAQVVGERRVTMGALFVIVGVLAVLVFVSALALSWLNATYDMLTGRPRVERRPVLCGDRIQEQDVIVTAQHPRGVWHMADVPLVRLKGYLESAEHATVTGAAAAVDRPAAAVASAIHWLQQTGILARQVRPAVPLGG